MSTNDNSAKIIWGNASKRNNDYERIDFFKRYDGPYYLEPIELGNHPLRKIVERQYEYMSRNLYFISAWSRRMLGASKEEEIVQAEDISARTIKNALDSIRRRNERAEAVLKDATITDAAQYGVMQLIQLPITSPGARLYGHLLVQADRFYSLNAIMWFHGEIDNKTRFANESEVRKEVQGVVRGVAGQFGYILKKTREIDAVEAARAGSHNDESEKSMAAEAEKVVDEEIVGNGMTSSVSNTAASVAAAASEDEGKTAKRTRKATAEPAAA